MGREIKVFVGVSWFSVNTSGVREHKAAAKCNVSAVADHVWNKQHQMDFHQVSILTHEQNQQQDLFYQFITVFIILYFYNS